MLRLQARASRSSPARGSLVGTAGYSNSFSWLSPIPLRRRVQMAGSISAQAACEDDPRYPSKIGSDPLDRKAPRDNDFRDRIGLPQADLRRHEPARHEEPREIPRDRAIGRESVRAAIETAARIVVAHFRHQRREIGRRDIRRVRDNGVESTGQSRAPIPGDKRRALAEAEPRRVVPRGYRRAVCDIDADPARVRIFVEKLDQQTAAAGAEIEKAVCRLAIE